MSIACLSSLANGVQFRKSFPTPISHRILPICCSRFNSSGFKVRSLIHLDLIFVQGNRYGSNLNFSADGNIVFLAPFVEDAIFSPVYKFLPLCHVSGSYSYTHVCVFYFITLTYISVLCQYHIIFITITVQYILKSKIAIPPVFFFLFLRLIWPSKSLLVPYGF